MKNRSKSSSPDARNRIKNRKNPKEKSGNRINPIVVGRKPLSTWLGRRQEPETVDHRSKSKSSFFAFRDGSTSSLPGLVRDQIGEWDSNSDSSHTNVSEKEAGWLLAFDDLMSQVGSKVSGIDELLEVLSVDGEDSQVSPRFSITVDTQNSKPSLTAGETNKSIQSASDSDVNGPSGLFGCVDNFSCGDNNFAFWETIRGSIVATCVGPQDFTEMMRSRYNERKKFLSELQAKMENTPITRTTSGRKVQFEMDTRSIPFWARRSWKRRSELQVIPKSNNDKAVSVPQSCLKNSIRKEMDGSTHSKGATLTKKTKTRTKESVVKRVQQKIQVNPVSPVKPVVDDNDSNNSIIEENEKVTTPVKDLKSRKVTLPKSPRLKSFFKPGPMARKLFHRKPVTASKKGRTEGKPLLAKIEVEALRPAAVGSVNNNRAIRPSSPRIEPISPVVVERTERVGSPELSITQSSGKSSESSNNSTLLDDWSSNSSKPKEEGSEKELNCRLLDRFSTVPSLYSIPKNTLEGLTIECEKSFEGEGDEVQSAMTENLSMHEVSKERSRSTASHPSRLLPEDDVSNESSDESGDDEPVDARAENNWCNFDDLDENGFPSNNFKVDAPKNMAGWTHVGEP